MEAASDVAKLRDGKKKLHEPGVIYLSTIPPFMSVKKIREILSHYGEIKRVFLQPDTKAVGANGRKAKRKFTEGWIEFSNKKVAKKVAAFLNNTQVGGKKRSKYYEFLWNMKYLHRFRWTHLNERLAYEKAVHDQRLRTEIAQAKRETNYYIRTVETSKKLKKMKDKRTKEGKEWKEESSVAVIQSATHDEISKTDKSLLASIFVSNT